MRPIIIIGFITLFLILSVAQQYIKANIKWYEFEATTLNGCELRCSQTLKCSNQSLEVTFSDFTEYKPRYTNDARVVSKLTRFECRCRCQD